MVLRRLAWWCGLGGGSAAMWAVGSGRLGLPAPWHAVAFAGRLQADGATIGAIALLRLVLLVAGAYLLLLAAVAEATRLPGVGRGFRRLLSVPIPGRSLVLGAIGVPALVLGTVIPTISAGAQPAGTGAGAPTLTWLGPATAAPATGDAPVLRWLPQPPVAPPVASTAPGPSPSWPTLGAPHDPGPQGLSPATAPTSSLPSPLLPSTSPPSTPLPASPPPSTPLPASPLPSTSLPASASAPTLLHPERGSRPPTMSTPPRRSVAPTPPRRSPPAAGAAASPGASIAAQALQGPTRTGERAIPATYTLQAGDHLWRVADRTLTAALGHRPDGEVLARYWWRLVELNRPALPDPGNPDFVLPGMVVVLPGAP